MSQKRRFSVDWELVVFWGTLLLLGGTYVARRAVQAKQTAQFGAIFGSLRLIEGAKEQWALEMKKKIGDVPTVADASRYLNGNKLPTPGF